jgi:hypothetical protein
VVPTNRCCSAFIQSSWTSRVRSPIFAAPSRSHSWSVRRGWTRTQ